MANKEIQPPKWADALLEWYCAPNLLDEIQGDLHEVFYARCKEKGLCYAQFFYVLDVLRSFSYRTIKKSSLHSSNLFGNSFAFALRKLARRKSFALINITGLSVGLSGALLIFLYVSHELSYDAFNEKADRIYRVYCSYGEPGEKIKKFPSTPPVLASTVKQEISGVEEIARVFSFGGAVLISYDGKAYNERDVLCADENFFNIFTANFLSGNPATSLSESNSVVLSKSTAIKYFGSVDQALGKTLDINTYKAALYKVTGVTDDFPTNAHFHFNALLSIDVAHEKFNPSNWLSHDPATYILLQPGMKPETTETQIRKLTEKILNPIYETRFGKSYEKRKAEGGLQEYRLQPLLKVHLFSADMGQEGDIIYVYLFSAVGVLLISIACFNYINLATARSSWEAKTAAIRKVLGATKRQLWISFFMEAMLVAMIAMVVAILLSQLVLVSDNSFTSVIHVFIPYHSLTWEACLFVLAVSMIVSLLSGLVPAGILSKLDPSRVIKGQLMLGTKGSRLRKVFVVVQFAGSMILMVCTFLIIQQLSYMQQKSLGFDKENLIVVRNIDKLEEKKHLLKETLASESFVTNSSLCYNDIGESHNNAAFTPAELIDEGRKDLVVAVPIYIGDQDYLNTLGTKLLHGHAFPPKLQEEHKQIILNKEALRTVGWQDRAEKDLIGKIIDVNGLRYELAGVVDDYHFLSLRQKMSPMSIVSHYYADYESLLLRIQPGTQQQAIQRIQEQWTKLNPDIPFEYSFLDEDLSRLYSAEQNMTVLFKAFAGLTIFIACLGLFGLTMYSTERRTKEIGIRKVLGASLRNVVFLLSQNIILLVGLASLFAAPIAWLMMHSWLQNFAYRIEISSWTFILSGTIILIITVLTISVQAIKAALKNPSESLKYE